MERRRSGRRNTKPKKSWKQKCKDCLRQFFAFLFSNVGIICLVIGYTLAGAVMFMKIEGKKEGEMDDEYNFWNKLNTSYNETLEHLWNIASVTWFSENGVNFLNRTEDELKKFQAVVVNGVKISDYDGGSIYKDRWSIYAAFLYCLTVITTIGYGNVFPHTVGGKVATIVYAIFGMPLFLLYLSNIGDLLAKSFKWLYAKFCLCKICRLRKRKTLNANNMQSVPAISSTTNSWKTTTDKTWSQNLNVNKRTCETTDGEDSDDEDTETETSSSTVSTKDPQDITVPISLCLAIMIGFISLGALSFAGQEELDFLDGSYFCFISLSTIGFGDIVPSTRNEWNFILCSIYLMLGMALIAMCFNLMQQDVVQKIRTCTDIVRRIARCRR
ncbi:hypothetical protein PGB90_004569 [Kerria lacca]